MNKTVVLVVEDDRPIRNLIVTTLKMHDYKYLTAKNGVSAIMEASSHHPDIVLLDLGLPDMEGVDVIKKIRTWSNMPIIVISARSEDSDKIEALDSGADDYITKPFSVEELLARIRVTQRRLAIIQAGEEQEVTDMVYAAAGTLSEQNVTDGFQLQKVTGRLRARAELLHQEKFLRAGIAYKSVLCAEVRSEGAGV